jgi:hypothetical protein
LISYFLCKSTPPPFNLETAAHDDKAMQGFDLESLLMSDRSQKVKAPPIRRDYGSKNCVNLLSSTAVSRFKKLKGLCNNNLPDWAVPKPRG